MRHRTWRRNALAAVCGLLLQLGAPPDPATAQQGTIRGVVESERTLLPLPGAYVELVGLNRGMMTDANGRFMFVGLSGTQVTLRVSLLGYRTAEQVTVRVGDMDVRIRLAETAIELDQIVVTGTAGGTQRRALGNSVTQVRAAETVELAHVPNLQSLLNARAPGVVISPGTGMVGSGSQIRIRGSNSFSLSNQPLVYVDGVRVDNAQATGPQVQSFGSSVISRINDFNPEDIESIEIIKGPAAATLYGTEASNGVIHIITKRGREGRPAWNVTIRQGANWFMNAIERTPVNYWRNPATGEVLSINLAKTEKERGTPLYRTGRVEGYSLSLSGGSADVRYYLAADLDREEGAQWNNRQRRASMRANLNILVSPTMDLATSVGYTGGRTYLSCEAGCGGVTWASYFSTPERAQGNMNPDPRGARSYAPEFYNQMIDFQDLSRFTGSLQLNHRPTEWFHQRLTLGIDDVREDNQSIQEKNELYLLWEPSGLGGKDVNRRDVFNQTVDYAGTFQFGLTPALTSSTSFGAQYYRRFSELVSASGSDFATPGLRVINAAAETQAGETYSENVTVGVYGQQQFNWRDRLFVTAALRADDNSAFGEEFDLVWYPKASLAWVISEEPFWNVGPVNALRLRAAYGEAGQQPGAFDALRTFASVPGPNDSSTVTPSTVGNPNLGPERSSEIELGFEASLFEDRVGLDFTWYNQTTRDAILLRPSAPSTGFPGSRYINVGKIRNRGFEALLRGTLLSTSSVKWDAVFSVARNDSKVLFINDEEDRIVVSSDFGVEHRVGYPLGAWFHRRVVSAEFDENGRVIRSSMMCDDGEGGTTPCYAPDGTTPIAPYVYLGRGEPKYEGTISTTITLGERIRLYGLMDFKTGFKKWDHVTRVRCSLNNVCHENVEPLQYVDKYPAKLAAYQTGAVFGAEYIRDSKFLRLREVSIGYTLPNELVQRFGATRATINLAARNLHTWSPWTGMDPEARFLSGSRGGFGPLEQNHLPQLTSFVTTINLGF